MWLRLPSSLNQYFFFFLCLLLAFVLIEWESAWATQPCHFPEDVPQTRPIPKDGGATRVRAGFYVIDLVEISTVKQQFTLDLFLEVEWQDSHLGNLLRQSGMDKCDTPMESVWYPGLIGGNDHSLKIISPEVLYVYSDGRVREELRILGTFGANFDLTQFPLDTQILPVIWISTKYGPAQLELISEVGGVEKRLSEGGWTLKLAEGKTKVYSMDALKDEKTLGSKGLVRLDFELTVERRTNYYVWKVFIPLCLIVFVSWAVFWIDPTQLGVQTGIGTGMMLTIVAFLFSLKGVLPQISYLTRLDFFVYTSLLFVFLAFLEALLTCNLAAQENLQPARRIDRWARGLFPLAFLAVIVWFWSF